CPARRSSSPRLPGGFMRPKGFEKAGNEDKICAILEELKARIGRRARRRPHMIHAWPLWNAHLEAGRRTLATPGAFAHQQPQEGGGLFGTRVRRGARSGGGDNSFEYCRDWDCRGQGSCSSAGLYMLRSEGASGFVYVPTCAPFEPSRKQQNPPLFKAACLAPCVRRDGGATQEPRGGAREIYIFWTCL